MQVNTDDTTDVPFANELSDDDIREAIRVSVGPVDAWATHDIPDDTDPVALVRAALAWLNDVMARHYQQFRSDDANAVVEETDSHVVFATGEHCVSRRDINEHSPYDVQMLGEVVNTLHHQLAREMTDYDWGYQYPLVVAINNDE